jgi:hypothetical protein
MPNSSEQQLQATSLDRLHDLSLPQEISWWPLAPGWYGLSFVLVLAALIALYRLFIHYRMNAYRRAALQELQRLEDQTAIAELLRRTALAVTPRENIAELTGGLWLDWLSSRCSKPMPDSIRDQLVQGVYGHLDKPNDIKQLKSYAAYWISNHFTSVHQI